MARMDIDTHAIAALEHATKLDESVASGWYNLGSLYARNGNEAGAKEAFETTIELDTRHVKARRKLIEIATEEKDVGSVISHGYYFLRAMTMQNSVLKSFNNYWNAVKQKLRFSNTLQESLQQCQKHRN